MFWGTILSTYGIGALLKLGGQKALGQITRNKILASLQQQTGKKITEDQVKKAIVKGVMVHKVLSIAQCVSLLKLFPSASDKIEVLESCITRLVNISQKHEFSAQFPLHLRPYIEHLINVSIANEPYPGSQKDVFLLKSINFKAIISI